MRDGGVDLVLAGHDHAYERGEGLGLKYVITGGAGAELYAKKHEVPESRFFASEYHFVEVAIDGAQVSVTAHRPSGGVLESCGYLGGGPWDCDPPAPPPSAVPSRARSACGCAVPGGQAAPGGGAALVGIVALARGRRRSAKRAAPV